MAVTVTEVPQPVTTDVNGFFVSPNGSRSGDGSFRLLRVPRAVSAALYRWSIKGTSILYSPLIYLVKISFPEDDLSLSDRLKEYLHDPLNKLLRLYAAFTLLMFVSKIVLHVKFQELQDWWNSMPVLELFEVYIAPREIPMWQVATTINAVITLALFFFAYKAIPRIEKGVWDATTIERGVGWVLFGRRILSIYTMVCLVYITLTNAKLLDYWQRIDWGPWFPWT
jgi:hypothetical protein